MIVIFLHMPKTGGSTINSIVRKKYKNERIFEFPSVILEEYGKEWKRIPAKERWQTSRQAFIDTEESKKRNLDAVLGHLWFGLHKHTEVKCEYVTFIRNPVHRLVSYFNYVHTRDEHPPTEKIRKRKMTLKEAIKSTEVFNTINNQQVKFLTGDFDPDIRSLDRAIDNIENHFLHVGITKNFDSDIISISKLLGWGIPLYSRKNVSEKRVRVSDISPSVIDEIIRRNRLDMALYEYVTSHSSSPSKMETYLFQSANWLRNTFLRN